MCRQHVSIIKTNLYETESNKDKHIQKHASGQLYTKFYETNTRHWLVRVRNDTYTVWFSVLPKPQIPILLAQLFLGTEQLLPIRSLRYENTSYPMSTGT